MKTIMIMGDTRQQLSFSKFATTVLFSLLATATVAASSAKHLRSSVAFSPPPRLGKTFRLVGSPGIGLSRVSSSSLLPWSSHPNPKRSRGAFFQNQHSSSSSTSLSLASRYDNLVSGLAQISIGFAIGVLYSESSIISTGCGPTDLSDFLERVCYQGTIASAGSSVFCRIVSGNGKGVARYLDEDYFGEGMLATSSIVWVRAAEVLSLLAVGGAVAALAAQMYHGERMDGLSGIDRELCRAVRDL